MSTVSGTAPRTTPAWRLGRVGRKAALLVHVVSGGVWIGVDVIVAVLVLTGRFADSPSTRGLAYRALASFVVWPMLTAGLVCLASGLLLGLGSKYGLVRYWWVLVKLVLNVLLCTLVLVALQPGMDEVAAYGVALESGGTADLDVANLYFPPLVSLCTLAFASWLGVFKPWGRVRERA